MAGLPAYKIVIRERGWLFVSCPRRGCGRTFAVKAKEWADSWKGHGRACPYCFKASKLPAKRGKNKSS